MAKRSYRGLFIISGSGWGYIWNYFFEIRGAACEGVDCRLIMEKGRELFVKLEFPWINRIIFVLNNRWTRSMACGPCPAVDGGTELTGAWPPATQVSMGAGQGAGEGEWNAGNLMVHSPELGRQRGGRATAVRAAVVGTPVRSMLVLGEWEMGGGMSAVRRGELLTLL
jgi:hypothetical protein